MVRTSARRAFAAATITGAMVAGFMAMPSMAGAADDTTTTMDHSAPTTAETSSTTTVPSTTTTTRKPTPPPVLTEVKRPGDSFTLSGSGCEFNGVAGQVVFGFGNDDGVITFVVPAAADGSWSVSYTLPADTPAGFYGAAAVCEDPATGDYFTLEGGVIGFEVEVPGSTEPKGRPDGAARAVQRKTETKAAAPKPVKSNPKFTG